MAEITQGDPTELRALASRVVDSLLQHLEEQPPREFSRQAIGTVLSTSSGPPATITVNINGQPVPNIRYVGTVPTVGNTVLIHIQHNTYICVGTLT